MSNHPAETVDTNRLRNWARAYQRLMVGGMGEHAHTACVDDFAADDGEYPYITAADVLGLLDRLVAVEALLSAPLESTPCAKVIDPDPAVSWSNGYSAALENLAALLTSPGVTDGE